MNIYHVSYIILPKDKSARKLGDLPVEIIGNTCFTIEDLEKSWIPELTQKIAEEAHRPQSCVWIISMNKLN